MQLTAQKVYNIKIGEILSITLMLYCILNAKNLQVPKFYRQLFTCFFLFGQISLMVLFWVDIYPIPDSGPLQQVGWITVSRLVELFGCLFLALFIHNLLISHTMEFNKRFLHAVDVFMFAFFVFFAVMYIAHLIGIKNDFVYGDHRLRGGFVEGGPFGLFVAYYLMLRISLFGIKRKGNMFLLLLTFLSYSKASILFTIFSLILYLFFVEKIRIKNIFVSVVFCSALIFSANANYGFIDKIMLYYNSYLSAEYLVDEWNEDLSFVAGRIAASHIAPKMIQDNVMLGVGLGNYSLTRNNPKYLGFFPTVSIWDLPGLGGLFCILLELGIVGLLLFLRPFIVLFKCSKERLVKWMIGLVILVQLFGLQTYFQYMWFLVGVMTAIDSKPEIMRSAR
jgi:hypothetical protein